MAGKKSGEKGQVLVLQDQVPAPTLKKVGGSDRDSFNEYLARQALASMWLAHARDDEARDRAYQAGLSALMGIQPKDELEGMIAAQLVAAQASAMECHRRSMIESQTFEGRNQNLAFANKASRTFAQLLETLVRYRGKGAQTVTVRYVNVYEGGQAVVGPITTGGGGESST